MIFFLTIIATALGADPESLGAMASPFPTPDSLTEFGSSSVDFTWLFVKMVFAMLFVIALAIVVIRYLIPKLAMVRSRGTRCDFKILDRIPLDSRKALYVIQIEGRRLLIGASENHVGLLTELEGMGDDDEPN